MQDVLRKIFPVKKIVIPLLLAVVLLALVSLPYRVWLEEQLEMILERKGLNNVQLSVGSIGLESASLENISFGDAEKLNLKNIDLKFSLSDVRKGNLRELWLRGLVLNIKKGEDGWVIGGFEQLNASGDKPRSTFALPVTQDQLNDIPFEHIGLEESFLNVTSGQMQLLLPLDLDWKKSPQPEFRYKGSQPALNFSPMELAAGSLKVNAFLNEEHHKWEGSWNLEDFVVKGTSIPIPMLNGQGTVSAYRERAELGGRIASADKLWQAEFDINYNFNTPAQSNITIMRASMPWEEGRIDVRNVKVPLDGKNPVPVTLQVQSVSIAELMQSLTRDRVSATGKVSGTLPLIVSREGKITVLQGTLRSEGPGIISMPADAIPGNDEQVALVRKILEDFQYSNISIALEEGAPGSLGVRMTFEGNNPAVYDGKPVKLNVNLTGDVLEFIQQNVLLLTDPEQFLKQENDENN
jgi:hypothetical protein